MIGFPVCREERDPDDAHDERVHEDMEVRRASAGVSAETLSLNEARADGARIGAQGLSKSLNPYQDHHPEHDAWNEGWQNAANVRAARACRALT